MKTRSCLNLWTGLLVTAVFGLAGGPPARADFIATITSSKDTMIFQNNPNNSDGGGIDMLAGTNSAQSIRRGLVAFDVASSVPHGAIIKSVQLTLTYATAAGTAGTGNPNLFSTGIYRLLGDWGEGTVGTGTGVSGVGQGQPAHAGDGTWAYESYNTKAWTTPGGDFAPTASATTMVGGMTLNVPFTWGSTGQMVSDVQSWLDSPSSNFGWIIRGQETGSQTFRGFYTREESNTAYQPKLTIDYVLDPTAVPEPTSVYLALSAMIGVLVASGSKRSRRILPWSST
jgi:hypothetical protein